MVHEWTTRTLISIGIASAVLVVTTVVSARYYMSSRRKRKITKIIETMEAFKGRNVRMKNRDRVEELVCQLIKGGKDKLQIVADFDMTLTKYRDANGDRCQSCHGVFDNSTYMPSDYRTEAHKLNRKYYPLEIDPTLTVEEKTPLMVEWYEKGFRLLEKCDIKREDIRTMVKASRAFLRDGCEDMLNSLHDHSVPVFIFSAGIGDILEEILKQNRSMHESNTCVVSNYIDWNEKGQLIGFSGDLIHSFNKNTSHLRKQRQKAEHYETLTGVGRASNGAVANGTGPATNGRSYRPNVIMLGDSIGDLNMIDSGIGCGPAFEYEAVLKIGFLNDKINERLNEFVDKFDVVLIDDQSMRLMNELLSKILL